MGKQKKATKKPERTKHWLSKYPWEKWMNGRKHTVVFGEDFTCSERAFAVYLYRKAKKERKRLELHSIGNRLSIQFFPLKEEKRSA